MDIEVGKEYKLNIPNSSGYYKVIEEYASGTFKVQGSEPHPRFVIKEAFVKPKEKAKKASSVVFEHVLLEKMGELNSCACYAVDILQFPKGERRGRKPKNV